MAPTNSYLNFDGNTGEAFNSYKSVLGGEFISLMRWKDAPEADKVPASDHEKIMHLSLPIGKGIVLMATDALESHGHPLTPGNNFYISIDAETEDEAERLFNKLSAGGQVTMALQKAFWGAYFGMFTDKIGIQWMVRYDHNQQK